MKWVTLLGPGVLLLVGCYTYRPLGSVDVAMPSSGTRLEVRLTTVGATALANEIGPDVRSIRGDVVSADSAAITLAITQSETSRHIDTEWRGEQVRIPRGAIAIVSERKFSVGTTALVGGLAGGGLVAAAVAFGTGSSNTGSIGGSKPGGVQ